MRILLFLFSFCCNILLFSQTVTHGPVVGSVYPDAAKIYYRTDMPARLTVECDSNPSFSNPQLFSDTTVAIDNSVLIPLQNLQPNTTYYYRVKINATEQTGRNGRFKTFPVEHQKGYYKLAVGSCNYNPGCGGGSGNPNWKNDVLFQGIVDFNPNLVLHLGDWGYPPSCLGAYYNTNPNLAAQSFRIRYTDENMKQFILPNLPIDYIYDDDYTQNGNAGWTYPAITTSILPNGQTKYNLEDRPMPAGNKEGAVAAYFKHFPAYPQIDTSGIHHTFKLGNIEFFVLDTRGAKSAVHEAFSYNSLLNLYNFIPSNNHSTLGPTQKQWLLNALEQSTADWKVIVSSVVFSKKMGEFINLVLAGQLFDRSLIRRATDLAYMWGGYPKDQNDLLNLIRNNNIKNVLMLSGDTHSSMMDDGRNSGIPEISASGWSAGNEGYLNASIDSVLQQYLPFTNVKEFLWNGGGNGVGNSNINDSYVQMEFFGSDSMRACVVDEFDQKISCMTIKSSIVATSINATTYTPVDLFTLFYPNPAKENLNVELNTSLGNLNAVNYYITDITGRLIISKAALNTNIPNRLNINLTALNSGFYLFVLEHQDKVYSRKFYKE